MKNFKQFREDMAIASGPTNVVSGIAGSGSPNLPQNQREPGVSVKRKKDFPISPVMFRFKRTQPKI